MTVAPMIEVAFPEPWQVLVVNTDAASDPIDALLADPRNDALGGDAVAALRGFVDRARPVLSRAGVRGIAALVVGDDSRSVPGDADDATRLLAEALASNVAAPAALSFAAVGTRSVPAELDVTAALVAVAEADTGEVIERVTTTVERRGRPMARSQTIRYSAEAPDADGRRPLVWRVRYTFPAGEASVAYVHCETTTVVYAAELEVMFDAIAETVVISRSVADRT